MIRVKLTRETDKTVSLLERSRMANEWDADYFISVHTNAGGGRGIETYHSRNGEKGTAFQTEARRVAQAVQSELVKATGLVDRGIKTRLVTSKTSSLYGMDYYSVIRRTHCPALIVEAGFHDNPQEEALLKTPEFRQKIAEAIAAGIRKAGITGLLVIDPGHGGSDRANRGPTGYIEADGVLDISLRLRDILTETASGTPILGSPQVTVAQAQAWAKKRGAHQRFIDIAPVYWKYGEKTGIREDVLYCQAAKETAFGRYGGAVKPEQNNWAGIKTRNATGDRPEDHESFPTPEDGVRAHFNHIAAYVGLNPLGEPHGRYLLVKSLPWAGTIRTVEELGGRWAPNPDYGNSIVRDYLNDLLVTPDPGKPENNLAEQLKQLEERNQVLEENLKKAVNVLADIKNMALNIHNDLAKLL